MHNAAFAALNLNWRYLAFEVDPRNLRAAIEGAKALGFVGLNLTVPPHKLLALEMVDELDDSAKRWGAVNTIRFEGRNGKAVWLPLHQFEPASAEGPFEIRSHGFNTDADALVASLREDLGLEPRGGENSFAGRRRGRAGGGAAAGFGKRGIISLQSHAE